MALISYNLDSLLIGRTVILTRSTAYTQSLLHAGI